MHLLPDCPHPNQSNICGIQQNRLNPYTVGPKSSTATTQPPTWQDTRNPVSIPQLVLVAQGGLILYIIR